MTGKPPILCGLDIGGTKSAAVIGDSDGRVVARSCGPTPQDPDVAVAFLTGLLAKVARECGREITEAGALGVSYGGPVDSRAGVVYTPPNLPLWHQVPLKRLLEDRFGIGVRVENDANATALAEWRWGAGQGFRDIAFLTMGTGIGAGLILEGRLYRGRTDLAGEIGHTTIKAGGPLCACGKRGCLEALASGTAIGRMGRERFGDATMTAERVCARAREGDAMAVQIIDEAASAMGVALANLLHTLNLERIILGTLAVHAGDLLLPRIRAAVQDYCWPRVCDGVDIVPAALGDSSQDLAALAVASGHATEIDAPALVDTSPTLCYNEPNPGQSPAAPGAF